MAYEHLAFARGYLLTDGSIDSSDSPYVEHVRRSWRCVTVGRFRLHHDPDLPVHRYESEKTALALLGTVVDPVNEIADPEAIVGDLHSCLSRSDDAFFDRLDDLSGRFVLLVETGTRAFCLQDATGTKTLFYDTGGDLAVASHASLLAELGTYPMSRTAREFIASKDYSRHMRSFPGLYTPYPAVRMLTPNTLLDLADRRVRRFFPRGPVEKNSLTDEVVADFSRLMRSQVVMLAGQRPLSVSLTAGIDSRVTIAATVGQEDRVDYFTYVEKPAQEREAAIARELCDASGGTHTTYHVDRGSWGGGLDDYMRVWRLNTAGMRADEQGLISKVLYENHPRERLHLKSIVSEVGGSLYRSKARGFLPNEINPRALAARYRINPRSDFVIEAFRQYIDTVGFCEDALFNYDLYDLFYWEFRTGGWGGLHTIDYDTGMDTFVLYNCRRVLEKMLSVPLEERLGRNLHKRAVELMWPEGARVPLLSDLKPWYLKATKEVARKVKYRAEVVLDRRRAS